MQVLRICLSNRGTPRRAEKLCHFHIFRPPLTSPISREIHLRSNLNFKPVKFCCWFCVSSRPEQKARRRGGTRGEDLDEFVRLHPTGDGRGGEGCGSTD